MLSSGSVAHLFCIISWSRQQHTVALKSRVLHFVGIQQHVLSSIARSGMLWWCLVSLKAFTMEEIIPSSLSPQIVHTIHSLSHTRTLRRTVIKCSSCVKCQAGLFSDIRFEPIQMLPFLSHTRKKIGGEG